MSDYVYTIPVAAELLELSARYISAMCLDGTLDAAKIKGRWFIDPASLQQQIEPDGYISTGAAAEMLGITQKAVSALCLKGRLQARKFRGRWVVNHTDVENYVPYDPRQPRKSRHPDACPRCGILTGGELCGDCRREQAGQYRWYQPSDLVSSWDGVGVWR